MICTYWELIRSDGHIKINLNIKWFIMNTQSIWVSENPDMHVVYSHWGLVIVSPRYSAHLHDQENEQK